jgi:hypothetical protein
MKKYLKQIILAALLFTGTAVFAVGDGTIGTLNVWKVVSGYLTPSNSSNGIKIPSLASSGDCLVTDGNGVVTTNTCGTGTGGSKWATSSTDYWLTTKTTDNLAQGSVNKYWSDTLFNNLFGNAFYNFFHSTTTDALPEGSTNKYDKTVTLTPSGVISAGGTYPNLTVGLTNSTVNGLTGSTSPSGILWGDNGLTTSLKTLTVGSGLKLQGSTLFSDVNYNLSYYLWNVTSTSSANFLIMSVNATTTQATITDNAVSNGQFLREWLSPISSPNKTVLPNGQYALEVYATESHTGTAQGNIYFEVWEANSAGQDIGKIGTTESTADHGNLSGTTADYSLSFSLTSPYTLASSASRIVLKEFAAKSGTGTANISTIVGNGTDSHLTFPVANIDTSLFASLSLPNSFTALNNFTNITASYASTSGIAITGLASKLLRTNALGQVSETTIGTGLNFDGTTLSSTITQYTDALANAYIHSSSSIPKTYTANTFGPTQTFTLAPVFSSLTGLLKGNGASAVGTAANGTDYTLITAQSCSAGSFVSALTANGGSTCTAGNAGTVTAVTATSPILSTGGATPNLSWTGIATGTTPVLGGLAWWSDSLKTLGTRATTSLTASAPLSLSQPISVLGSVASALTCATAASGVAGCLDSTTFDTFNGKENALTFSSPLRRTTNTISWTGVATGTTPVASGLAYWINSLGSLGTVATGTVSSSGGITVTSLRSVLGGAMSIACDVASDSIPGCLSAADHATFGAKQDALVSGTNIKTINSQSLLGSGDIAITGGGSSYLNQLLDVATSSSNPAVENGRLLSYNAATLHWVDVATSTLGLGYTVANTTYFNSMTYGTTTTWTASTTLDSSQSAFGTSYGENWADAICYTDGTLNVQFYWIGTSTRFNVENFLVTGTTTKTFSTNTYVPPGARKYVVFGTPSNTPTYVTCTLRRVLSSTGSQVSFASSTFMTDSYQINGSWNFLNNIGFGTSSPGIIGGDPVSDLTLSGTGAQITFASSSGGYASTFGYVGVSKENLNAIEMEAYGASQILFELGNAYQLAIDPSGWFGFGTTSPGIFSGYRTLLTAQGTSANPAGLTVASSTAKNAGYFGYDSQGFNFLDIKSFFSLPIRMMVNNILALFIDPATGNVGIATSTPLFKLDVDGLNRSSGNVIQCPLIWPSNTAGTADMLGSATVPGYICGSQMFYDMNTTGSIQAPSDSLGFPAPSYNQLRADAAANTLSFIKTPGLIGAYNSNKGLGIAMETWISTPNIATATTSITYFAGFSDAAGTSLTTTAAYVQASNLCGIAASSTPNWQVWCNKAGVPTMVNSTLATSTTMAKITMKLDSTNGFSVYAFDRLIGNVPVGNVPTARLRATIGVGRTVAAVATTPYFNVGSLKIWTE